MAVAFLSGFESAAAGLDSATLTGSAAYSTAQARTGSRSMRCNPASSASGSVSFPFVTGWVHFGLYIVTLPVSFIVPVLEVGIPNLELLPSGKLALNSVQSSTTLATGRWYWIGVRAVAGAFNGVWVQIDGVDEITTSVTGSPSTVVLGFAGAHPIAREAFFDDVIIDNAGFIPPSKVIELLPTANSAVGTGWTLGSGGATGQWDAVNNQPPAAVADAGTTNQIRNAASSANSSYDATLQTYTVGGVSASDTVLAVRNIIATAAPVTTSAKQGLVGNVSNPAITTVALAAGGTAGAFWSGTAGGTYPTGWKSSFGTLTISPSVTVGTAPVMRVTQVTASTRIAMVAYMALRVAWTPAAAVAESVPYTSPYPPLIAQ